MLKRAVRCLLTAFGIAIVVNGVVLAVAANQTTGSFLTIILGLVIIIPSVFTDKIKRLMGKYAVWRFAAVAVAGVVCITVLTSTFLAIYGNNNTVTYNEDYLIILGCGVRGTKPTEPLRSRLDTALGYLESNDECDIIVSGGRGHREDVSEAEAMRTYLVDHGVDNERIVCEDKSTSTYENFKYSNIVVDNALSSESTAFITNDFHIYRANTLAHLQGFHFTHMSAPTSWYNILPVYLREHLAIIKMMVFNE